MRARKLTAELIADLDAAGYVIVPKEPTAHMTSEGGMVDLHTDFDEEGGYVGDGAAADVWRAMIAAAPKQTETST